MKSNNDIAKICIENFFKLSFIFIIVGSFFYIMQPFLLSIIFGGILAMAFIPFVDFGEKKGLKRNTSLNIFTILLILIALVPVSTFLIRVVKVAPDFLHESNFRQVGEKIIKSSYLFIDRISSLYGLDNMMVKEKISQMLTTSSNYLTKSFNTFFTDLPTLIMMGLIGFLSIYFFLRESHKIRLFFDSHSYFNKKNGNKFIDMMKSSCREVFFLNFITGLIQASIVSIGALIFSVGDFFLVFFCTFLVSFIPVIGAAPVALALSGLSFMDSQNGAGIGLLIIAVITGISDNIARPMLGSMGKVHIHPFIELLAVIGGVILFGFPGLFIGPLLASLTLGAVPIILDEYNCAPSKTINK